MKTFQELQDQVADFNRRTFPRENPQAKLRHAIRELNELIENMDDDLEWADVLILFLAAAAMTGRNTETIISAAEVKMKINEARKWGKADADGVIEHIREA